LVVTKGKLGVEFEAPFTLGPIVVSELVLSIPDARFPIELSGGVGSFRHRRGELEFVAIEVPSKGPWADELVGLFASGEKPEVMIAPIAGGWHVGLRGALGALAFEVMFAPADDDLRLIPVGVRGLGLAAPLHEKAIAVVERITRPFGKRIGGAIVIERASKAICQALLPLAGMRAPSSEALRWSSPELELGSVCLRASASDPPQPPLERTVRAVELAALAADAEVALARGDLEDARRQYLAALDRAPRHPELTMRLAEIDRVLGNAEVALGVLADLGPAVDGGPLAGELFFRVGDRDAAMAAFRRAAEEEPYGSLAALCWQRVAELSEGAEALAAIDRAVSCAPSWIELRWRRFEARLAHVELRGALADAAEIELSTRGAPARHRVARRIADRLLERRHLDEAAIWFERALRYRPDSADAVAGLARSLGMLGHSRRALELHARAVALAQRVEPSRAGAALTTGNARRMIVELARALVDIADDRPAAIAHVRSIPALAPEAFEARICEARWRAALGDLTGASDALARLGDEVEHALGVLVEPTDPDHRAGDGWPASFASRRDAAAAIAAYLEEGARIEEVDRGNRLAARRLLGLALRLEPRKASLAAAFRRVAEGERARASSAAIAVQPEAPAPLTQIAAPREEVDDEALAEQLSEKLRADPSDVAVVLRLADVLARLGRDHDLLALLSARLEEEGEAVRAQLLPRRRSVLDRLRQSALTEGRTAEVELYELMLARE
jgi:tetratricopeptide (TPR) repeat protein